MQSGRKSKSVTITAEGRDKGKVFVITEMDAAQAEEWAWRALEAIAQKTEIPAGLANAGMLGIFVLGLKPILSAPFAMIKPLLDEMFAVCLSFQPDPANPTILRGAGTVEALGAVAGVRSVGPMIKDDIQEVATRVHLRDQIIELHTGFSPAAMLSQTWAKALAAATALQNTQTSPNALDSSSQQS